MRSGAVLAGTVRLSAALAVSGCCMFGFEAAARDRAAEEAVDRAVALLPKRPARIVILDVNRVPAVLREKLRGVEAFVTTGDPTVYLNGAGSSLCEASKGPGPFDYVLATKIWHEMAHIAGADEHEAQRAEETLWGEFIVWRKVDGGRGLAYLNLLRSRRWAAAAEPSARLSTRVDPQLPDGAPPHVSQAFGPHVSMPRRSQLAGCSDEPCVSDSGTTCPCD